MNQQQNMDPNGYWTGPKEHKPIVKVNGEWKFLKDLDAEEKAWVVDTSERFGEGIEGDFLADPALNAGGGMTGGPLTASVIRSADAIDAAGGGMTGGPLAEPDDYNSGWDFLTGVPHELETLLSTIPAEDKQKAYDTSHKYGGGFDVSDYTVAGPLSASVTRAANAIDAAGGGMTGGLLSAPADYDTYQAPVQEYVSNNYDTGYVGTGNYSGMSYGL